MTRTPRLDPRRVLGPQPAPLIGARLARPGEVPRAAAALLKVVADPWTAKTTYALGAAPYTWDRRAGGYVLADSVAVRLAHPDGRRAVAVWCRGQVAVRGKEWTTVWRVVDTWRWRAPMTGWPQPIPITALRAAVGDPTWRATPYVIEDAA